MGIFDDEEGPNDLDYRLARQAADRALTRALIDVTLELPTDPCARHHKIEKIKGRAYNEELRRRGFYTKYVNIHGHEPPSFIKEEAWRKVSNTLSGSITEDERETFGIEMEKLGYQGRWTKHKKKKIW